MSNKVVNSSEGLKDRKLLTFKEVCRLYGFTEWGLRHLIRTVSIPHTRIRRKIYFVPKKLDAWIEEHEIKALV